MFVELHDADSELQHLANTAAGGEEVVLMKEGKPFARLTTLEPRRRLGGLAHLGFKVPDDFNEMGREEIEEMFYGNE